MYWLLTFLFVNITWVLFRSKNLDVANNIILNLFNFNSINQFSLNSISSENLAWAGVIMDFLINFIPLGIIGNLKCFLFLVLGFIVITQPNSMQIINLKEFNYKHLGYFIFLFVVSIYSIITPKNTMFLYFNF